MGHAGRHRAKVALRRRRDVEKRRAQGTQMSQAAAQRLASEEEHRRKLWAVALMVLAGVVFATHLTSHATGFHLFSAGVDDLSIGYPTAFILLILGLKRL